MVFHSLIKQTKKKSHESLIHQNDKALNSASQNSVYSSAIEAVNEFTKWFNQDKMIQ